MEMGFRWDHTTAPNSAFLAIAAVLVAVLPFRGASTPRHMNEPRMAVMITGIRRASPSPSLIIDSLAATRDIRHAAKKLLASRYVRPDGNGRVPNVILHETIYVASSNAGKLRDFAAAAAVFDAKIAAPPGGRRFLHPRRMVRRSRRMHG